MKCSDILYPTGANRLDAKVATALFLILFSTQITLTAPFSYLPAMVLSFGYSEQKRGFYAGMIASSLFVGRFFGGYFWGWLTDKIGRRPVLLLSSLLVLLSTLAFGFSTSFYVAVATRFLQGLFNGVIVCGRAAFAEICDETNQSIGVSLVFAAWNSAIVFGPAVGGFLAEPAKKYPETFGNVTFFERFPFVLPSLLVCGILLFSIGTVLLTFKDTKPLRPSIHDSTYSISSIVNIPDEEIPLLKTREYRKENQQQIMYTKEKEKEEEEENIYNNFKSDVKISYIIKTDDKTCFRTIWLKVRGWAIYELLTDKTVLLVIMMFAISGFCIIGFSELSSLWMATDKNYGGLDFSTDQIGTALLIPAIISVIVQPIVFSRFEKKYGGIKTVQLSLLVLGVFTVCFPFIHYAIKNRKFLWSLLILAGLIRMIADISSRSALALFINNSVFAEQVGRVNGLAFSIQEIMRVASPTMFGALFSWAIDSKKHDVVFPVDFTLPFIVISVVIFTLLGLSLLLPKSINGAKPVALAESDYPKVRYVNKHNML